MDTNELAKQLAGNWRQFQCFYWNRESELDNPDNWGIVYTSNRDSGILEESNANAIKALLKPYIDRGDILEEYHNHWAVGYVEGYAIKVYTTRGKITKAFLAWLDICSRLEDYPVLDEDDYCQREFDATLEAIEQQTWNLDKIDNLPDDWQYKVYDWLSDNDPGELENIQDHWPNEESIKQAMTELEYIR